MYKNSKIIKVLITVFYVLQLCLVRCQINDLDTVFVKKAVGENEFDIDTLYILSGRSTTQVLAGTTILPYSDRMIGLLNRGLSPISIEVLQECEEGIGPDEFYNYPRFIDVSRNLNTLTIDVSIIANCCHTFLGEAEVVDSDTLNLMYISYGGFCSCECCFTLRYKFDTSMEENYQILNCVTINGSSTVSEIPKK